MKQFDSSVIKLLQKEGNPVGRGSTQCCEACIWHNEEHRLIQIHLNNGKSKFCEAEDDVVRKIQQVVLVAVMY